MTNSTFILLIVGLPFLSFLLLILSSGSKLTQKVAGQIATLLMAVTFFFAAKLSLNYFASHLTQQTAELLVNYTWLEFGSGLAINMGVLLDSSSSMMLLVVTFISLMVHIFSLGYMHHEERIANYFAFLGLFTFSMLGLILSSNIFQIYIFWELVGVSSFLLIGFYYHKSSAVAAAKKAFIVTRFADLGFLIGILILGYYGESFDFTTLISRLGDVNSPQYKQITMAGFAGIQALSWGLILVFIGGAGKSAMFPLHIWLPDAMEGPTPVSALIHAATMVVAGVFLVARLFPIFTVATAAPLQIITYIGAFSALFAALIACTQTDIKRVLAYSTMSQIGFMMFSLGVIGDNGAGYNASLFHLFTHAFFKSLLFLGAGSIIHYVHSNEMEDMGGLRKKMPLTHISFLIACLAISGIPPFAGFFSKEAILHAAYTSNKMVFFVGIITSFLTAFYMFRLYFTIFWSIPEYPKTNEHGEGTWSMKLPLMVLTLASILVGFIPFSKYVNSNGIPVEGHLEIVFSIGPVLLSIAGILLAAYWFKTANTKPQRLAISMGNAFVWVRNKFYIDQLYLYITKEIVFKYFGKTAAYIDKNLIDGFYLSLAHFTGYFSFFIRGIQSGNVQHYALYFFGGILGLVSLLFYLLSY
ncbi:MAG: NADH-quinone oxidoreductase subunit L [Bacteroidia bacterium]|nr:NADH-quinone oxidoreductase subunit L [Bacteroidia bacterium]